MKNKFYTFAAFKPKNIFLTLVCVVVFIATNTACIAANIGYQIPAVCCASNVSKCSLARMGGDSLSWFQYFNFSSQMPKNEKNASKVNNSSLQARATCESGIQSFLFNAGSGIRVLNINGDPWFIAADVCHALRFSNVTVSIKPLGDDERSKIFLGRQGYVWIINESGLYALIFRCHDAMKEGTLPYRFRKWVTSEVLPSIRKTGMYATGNTAENLRELSELKAKYQHLEMMYRMERKLRELFQKERDYYVKDRDEWRNRTMERNNRLLQFIITG